MRPSTQGKSCFAALGVKKVGQHWATASAMRKSRGSYVSSRTNRNNRVLVTLAILATFNGQIDGKLIVKPKTTDVRINDSVYFNCSTDLGSRAIFWFHGSKYIYTGFAILEPYHERFEVEHNVWNGTFVYNLVIHSVKSIDAGEIICAEDEGFGEKYSVQLVVLENDPICRSSRELNEVIGQNTCNVEADELELKCIVTYRGNIPPQMEWKKVGENSSALLNSSIVTSGHRHISTLRLRGEIALNNSSFVCSTKRSTQKPTMCISEAMKIVYALGGNSTVNKTIGDEIHCHANASQHCTYMWKWLQDNDVTIESSTAVLKAKKPGWHRCEAECQLKNETCILLVMRAMVYGEKIAESSQTRTIIISVVVTVVITVVAVFAAIFVIVLCKESDKECCPKEQSIEMPEMEECRPTSIHAPVDEQPEICGITSLHQEVFVSRQNHSVIEVYDSVEFQFNRRMVVEGMGDPGNIVVCSVYNCLYAVDSRYQERLPAILRINPINGNVIKHWNIHWRGSLLSVANDSNLILSTYSEASLHEYTADGELLRTIFLGGVLCGRRTRDIKAKHALKLDNGLFVVCQTHPNRVYLLSTKETSSTSGRIDEVEVVKKVSKKSGELKCSYFLPEYLSVNKEGSILVSDNNRLNNRAVLMSPSLDKARILVSEPYGMKSTNRTCFDESTGKWLLTNGRHIFACRLKDENVKKVL